MPGFKSLQFLAILLCPTLATLAQVKVELVSSVGQYAPGQSFEVGVVLHHEPHWHTYWQNPGTGYPTSIVWNLPAGWSAGEIAWPTPELLVDESGQVNGYGYNGTAVLRVPITPAPDASGNVTIRAEVDYLMCRESCQPGNTQVSLKLPAGQPEPNSDWPDLAAQSPQPARTAPGSIRLETTNASFSLHLPESLPAEPAYFFPDSEVVPFDAVQRIRQSASDPHLVIELARGNESARPTGVLRFSDGSAWRIQEDTYTTVSGDHAAPVLTAKGKFNLFGTLGLALLGGMILNLMPCVFPVIGLKILGFVQQAGAKQSKVIAHGFAYTLGVLVSFWLLAGLLALLRASGSQLGWGFQLQSPAFVFTLCLILLAVGLNLSGLFEFGLSATRFGGALHQKEGLAGSFFSGCLATVVATPCSAPFLAPALGAALSLPLGASFAVFTAIGLGLATPYLLLSLFPAAIRFLPRPGAWMETFKQAMAFPVYITIGLLVWVLAGQLEPQALLATLVSLPLAAGAVWIYGRSQVAARTPRKRLWTSGLAVVFLAGALAVGFPRPIQDHAIEWEPWSPERVVELRSEGRTIYVDFTARWCFTCQTNKKLVFGSDAVLARFRENNIATLRGDWTNADPAITAELARWNRSAVPFNLVYRPDLAEPVVLPEILSAATVLESTFK